VCNREAIGAPSMLRLIRRAVALARMLPPSCQLRFHATEAAAPPSAVMSAYVRIRQHTQAYASIRQHTPAYVSMRQCTRALASFLQASLSRT
jgi:hypothetical protein